MLWIIRFYSINKVRRTQTSVYNLREVVSYFAKLRSSARCIFRYSVEVQLWILFAVVWASMCATEVVFARVQCKYRSTTRQYGCEWSTPYPQAAKEYGVCASRALAEFFGLRNGRKLWYVLAQVNLVCAGAGQVGLHRRRSFWYAQAHLYWIINNFIF